MRHFGVPSALRTGRPSFTMSAVKVVYQNICWAISPCEGIGPDSEKALFHVLAAGEQGKLWQYADELYANQGEENSGWVTDALLERVADDLGLDFAKLQADAGSQAVLDQANAMATEASDREVPGTPWFYVQIGDGEPYEVRPSSFAIEEFRQILDDALSG